MKKYFVLFILLPFLSFGALINNPDSVINIIPKLENNEKALAYIKLAQYYTYIKQDSINLEYIKKANEIETNKETKGLVYFWQSFIYLAYKDDQNHLTYLNKAYATFQNTNDSLLAETLYWQARAYERKGLYPEALSSGLESLKVAEKIKNKKLQIAFIQEIGYIYDRMSEFEKAIEWHKKCLIIAIQTENKRAIGRSYGLIGIAYDELKNYSLALENNLKAVDYFTQVNDTGSLITWYSNIGNTYTKMGDLENAEKYLLNSINLDKKNPSVIAKINLGKVYIEQNRFNDAENILQTTLTDLIKNDEKQFTSEAYFRLHELRKKQGRFKEALEYFTLYSEIQDEMLNTEKFQQINDMTIRYETQEKEKELAKQKLKVAENELKIRNKNNLILIIAVIALTLSLLAFIVISHQQFKNKQLQKEKELNNALAEIETNNKLQNQRLEISRDLHDSIGSQLTFIISSIENLKMFLNDNENFLGEKLSSLSNFTKETIQELRDTIWAMNKNEINIEDLNSRISNYIEQAKISLQNKNFYFINNILENINFEAKKGMHIYRIIQESVNNAIKHSNASEIKVSINKNDNKLIVEIEDNGKGFNPSESMNKGNGFNSIKKRAEEINGNVEIDSKINKTTIKLITPIP